jgi:hypothetical protein
MRFLRSLDAATLALAALLALGSGVYLGLGLAACWQGNGQDLRTRQREWSVFAQRIYPNPRLNQPVKPRVLSVYPPWALPLFGLFFGTGNFEVACLVLQVLSLAALGAMMWLGWRELAPCGQTAGWLGLALAPAVAGNYTALAYGQFSILCAGLLAGQILAVRGQRPVLAGVCWALAMLKPQIAVPFALLFVLQRQWRGLLAGSAVLVLLSTIAFGWTRVSPLAFFEAGIVREHLRFVHTDAPMVTAKWIDWLGVSPRTATGGGLALLGLLALALVWRDIRDRVSVLNAAGVCAMLGFVLFYHRRYDDQMLYPLMLALTARAFARGWQRWDVVAAGFLGLVLYPPVPTGTRYQSQFLSLLVMAAPVLAALVLVATRPVALTAPLPPPARPCS